MSSGRRGERFAAMTIVLACALTCQSSRNDGVGPPAAAGGPDASHVSVVIMENRDYGSLVGNAQAPYLNTVLMPTAALMTNSHAVHHPSQPNYLELFSGGSQGVTSDVCPHQFTVNNVASELIAAGRTFSGFAEAMPTPGYTGCSDNSGRYQRKHNPWVDFKNVPASANLTYHGPPASLPDLAIIVPDMCHDMHDCSTTVGDNWLATNLPPVIQWNAAHNGLLILTWDEADPDKEGTNHIATLLVGPMIRAGRYASAVTHDDVLRTIEDIFHVACTGAACSRTGILGVWR